jgi:hypothetical protein
MGKKHKKKRTFNPYVEVVSLTTHKIKIINIEEKKVFFDEKTHTYLEVVTGSSNYCDEDNSISTKDKKIL